MSPVNDNSRQALESLKWYLRELLDTGVDGLPVSADKFSGTGANPAGAEYYGEGASSFAATVRETPDAEYEPESAGPQAPAAGVTETLEDIRNELGDCALCSLGGSRTNLVFGVGNPNARLVFVGEAPGRDEDLQGIPFMGKAGELLTSMIQRMGFKRDEVYICNVLKCRPPNNRNPLPNEIEMCHPFLLRQLKAIGPIVIVALGTFAAQTLLETREPISKLRGRFHDYHGIPLMPTFHPSFLLRNGPEMRWVVWEDMVKVLELMGVPVPEIKRKRSGLLEVEGRR
ncbi:MAG TPA: uracil-DNA glycosylase [Geobacteraceae bacterium]|nr:uracil-DNA glycosylase [Geobacteraceae bacterium]